MSEPELRETRAENLRETAWLSVAALVVFIVLLLSVLADVGGRVGHMVVTRENWVDVLNAFLLALLVNLPTLILLGVLTDFSDLFKRTGEGEVFTQRNLRTLRNAGSGLIWAAAASALIVPNVLRWIELKGGGGFLWQANDLALGVAAMGIAILGLSHVFAEGIRIKTDSDQIV